MSLLARYAEHLFWMARYMERADSLARIIETHAAYDRGRESETSWKWLVQLYADDEEFEEKYTDASQRNVLHFYIRDLDHPGSILSAIKAARENARALRAYLPTEMWSQLNEFYNRIMLTGEAEIDIVHLSRTCGMIKSGCQAQFGIADSTLYRDEGWRFYGLGQFLERADQTSRLLDVKFAQLAAEKFRKTASPTRHFGHWFCARRPRIRHSSGSKPAASTRIASLSSYFSTQAIRAPFPSAPIRWNACCTNYVCGVDWRGQDVRCIISMN